MKFYLLDVVNPSTLSKTGYSIHSFLLFAHNLEDAKKRALDLCPEDNINNIYELDREEVYDILGHICSLGDI